MMTPRERFLATLRFGTPDRIPLRPGWGRRSTRERWQREGLPADANPVAEACRLLDLPSPDEGGEDFPLQERMIPTFEEKVIEVRERSQVVQDWKGNICEIGKEFTTEYLRNGIDFVTRSWIKCPVETRADWEDMQRRYDPAADGRLPADAAARGARLRERRHVVSWTVSGPFWVLREWLGFENLCLLFLDDPSWIREMIGFWTDYLERLLRRGLEHVVPDHVLVNEDMAYKCFPMISPEMTREFLLPTWRRWGELLKGAGVPIYEVDSDGDISTLIPVFIDAGFDACSPMEVAAGIDLPALRERFGRRMAFQGGVDKRCIAKGGDAITAEIARLRPVIRSGGFIPGCDHGVPHDVSWSDYVRYVGLLAAETGWR